MENSQELIGVLQAISVVAKKLAEKLMRIDREIKDYEAARTETADNRKSKTAYAGINLAEPKKKNQTVRLTYKNGRMELYIHEFFPCTAAVARSGYEPFRKR